jgi:hypothetical protein
MSAEEIDVTPRWMVRAHCPVCGFWMHAEVDSDDDNKRMDMKCDGAACPGKATVRVKFPS